jgi:hypothetical protein
LEGGWPEWVWLCFMWREALMAPVSEREENAYTLGVQAGLWGYPLAHRVEASPPALRVKGIG